MGRLHAVHLIQRQRQVTGETAMKQVLIAQEHHCVKVAAVHLEPKLALLPEEHDLSYCQSEKVHKSQTELHSLSYTRAINMDMRILVLAIPQA